MLAESGGLLIIERSSVPVLAEEAETRHCTHNEVQLPLGSAESLFNIVSIDKGMDELDEVRFTAKQTHYRGTAKIRFRHLTFDTAQLVGARTLDKKNILRLVRIFELEGCTRLEPEHYVPAVIKEADLDRAIARSHVTRGRLFDCTSVPPVLDFEDGCVLECLHGRHRLEAAQAYFESPADMWWTVDLYAHSK